MSVYDDELSVSSARYEELSGVSKHEYEQRLLRAVQESLPQRTNVPDDMGQVESVTFAGADEDVRDDAFDLRHDQSGIARFQGGDIVGGVVNPLGLRRLHFDRHGLRGGRFRLLAVAACSRENKHGQKSAGQNQK